MDVACNIVCLHGPELVLTIRMMGQAVAIIKNGKEVKRPRVLSSISAIYHVTNRGDGREPIFQDDGDRQRFVKTPFQSQFQRLRGPEHRLAPS